MGTRRQGQARRLGSACIGTALWLGTAGVTGIAPGVARMQALRREVEAAGVRCIFSEPQFPGALVEAVAEGTGARIATLDPLGVGLEPGPDAYPALLVRFADAVIDCLDRR